MITEAELFEMENIDCDPRIDIPRLIAEVKCLRDALKFYADEINYSCTETLSCGCCSVDSKSLVAEDNGKAAREALGAGRE